MAIDRGCVHPAPGCDPAMDCSVGQHVLPQSLCLWEELGLAAPRAFSGNVGPEGGSGVGMGFMAQALGAGQAGG